VAKGASIGGVPVWEPGGTRESNFTDDCLKLSAKSPEGKAADRFLESLNTYEFSALTFAYFVASNMRMTPRVMEIVEELIGQYASLCDHGVVTTETAEAHTLRELLRKSRESES
jgi:hypothetical protein